MFAFLTIFNWSFKTQLGEYRLQTIAPYPTLCSTYYKANKQIFFNGLNFIVACMSANLTIGCREWSHLDSSGHRIFRNSNAKLGFIQLEEKIHQVEVRHVYWDYICVNMRCK